MAAAADADPDRLVRWGDVVGTAEIAERLGVAERTVQAWHYRHPETFPRARQRSAGLLWAWPDVAAWARVHRPELVDQLEAGLGGG